MSVSREEVLRIAQLAELDVDEEALATLAEQMSRILDYAAQLSAVPANGTVKVLCPVPMRSDSAQTKSPRLGLRLAPRSSHRTSRRLLRRAEAWPVRVSDAKRSRTAGKAKRLNALLTPPKELRKSLNTQMAAARPTGVLYGCPVAVKTTSARWNSPPPAARAFRGVSLAV